MVVRAAHNDMVIQCYCRHPRTSRTLAPIFDYFLCMEAFMHHFSMYFKAMVLGLLQKVLRAAHTTIVHAAFPESSSLEI
jgi:hypothetical protein